MPLHLDFVARNGVPMRAVRLGPNEPGNYPAAVESEPLVEFYDRRHPHTPDGQFTGGRYFVTTLRERDQTIAGLSLAGDVEDWRVDSTSMGLIMTWLDLADRVES